MSIYDDLKVMEIDQLIPLDYKRRWVKVREMMAKENMAGLIAYSNCKITGNTVYLADYLPRFGGWESVGGTDCVNFGSALVFLPLEGEPVTLTDLGWDVLRAQEESQVPDTRHSNDFGVDLAKIIKGRGITGHIGIAPWFIFPAAAFNALTALCPNNTFGATKILEKARQIKEDAELQRMRQAQHATELGVLAGLNAVKEGVTEAYLCNIVEYTMKEHGDLFLGSESIVGTGVHTSSGSVSAKKYIKCKDGDLVQFDICGRYEGYCGDVSRVKICGNVKPSDDVKRLYDAVLAMNTAVREAMKPGVLPSELQKLGHNIAMKDFGFKKENLIPLTGHCVGLDIHEPPDYGVDETPLAPNMVITVEPCLVWKGVAGIRVEDLMLITEKGSECLSLTSRDLVY